jgi:hypothetical protein
MPDYRDAAERHWEDAGFLINDNRIANTDHLFGMAAECALKAVMQTLGMKLTTVPTLMLDEGLTCQYQMVFSAKWHLSI